MNLYRVQLCVKGVGRVPHCDYGDTCEDIYESIRERAEVYESGELDDYQGLRIIANFEAEDLWDLRGDLDELEQEIAAVGFDLEFQKPEQKE